PRSASSTGWASTPTIMQPSPNHLAIRTPRRDEMSRVAARNAASICVATVEPLVSVKAMNPHRSTNANVRSTSMRASCLTRASVGYMLGMGIDVRAAVAREAEHRHPELVGGLDGEARRRRHGDHHGETGDRRLLHHLEAHPPGQHEDVVGLDPGPGEQGRADELVDGVVPADVLPHGDERAVTPEPTGGMDGAGPLEHRL